jgi:predicted transcriptional regulator
VSADNNEVAYQLYKSLGEERTYARVAELLGKSEKTIRNYGYQGKWQERLNNEFLEKSYAINKRREELELKGFEVAIAVMDALSEKVKNGKITKEMAQIYEVFLTCPLSMVNKAGGVEEQSAGDVHGKEKIEIIFDVNGGVSSED